MASPSVPITIATRGASVAILSRTHKLRMSDFSGTTIKIYNNVRCCEGRRRHCDPANKLSMCRWANAFSLPVHLFVRVYISMRRVPKRRKKKPKYFFTFWVIVNVGIPTALNYEKKRLQNMAWQIMPVHLPLCLRVLRRRQDLLPLHFFVNQIYKTWQPWRLGDACKKNHWLAVWNVMEIEIWPEPKWQRCRSHARPAHSTFPATNTREFKFCTQWVFLKNLFSRFDWCNFWAPIKTRHFETSHPRGEVIACFCF